jgi:hypothetical protein
MSWITSKYLSITLGPNSAARRLRGHRTVLMDKSHCDPAQSEAVWSPSNEVKDGDDQAASEDVMESAGSLPQLDATSLVETAELDQSVSLVARKTA